MQHYVYIYLSKDRAPVYVGEGSRRRFLDTHRIPVPPRERIIKWEVHDQQTAYEVEKEFIALFGRADLGTGSLLNLTDGGLGALNPTAHHRAAMRKTGKRVGSTVGHLQGKKNVESGLIQTIATKESRAKGGERQGRKNVESGQLAKIQVVGGQVIGQRHKESGFASTMSHIRWHVKRGVVSPTCKLCQSQN